MLEKIHGKYKIYNIDDDKFLEGYLDPNRQILELYNGEKREVVYLTTIFKGNSRIILYVDRISGMTIAVVDELEKGRALLSRDQIEYFVDAYVEYKRNKDDPKARRRFIRYLTCFDF